MIRVIDKIDELQEKQSDWKNLLLRSSESTPFQSIEFISSSWDVMNTKNCSLYIVIYSSNHDNEVQAIFPFYIDHRGFLRFINDRHADFCEAIILDKVKRDYHLWDEVYKYIYSDKKVRGVVFSNLRAISLCLPYFHYFFSPSFVYCQNAYARLNIGKASEGEHFSTLIPNLNGAERKKIRYWYNRVKGYTLIDFTISQSLYPKDLIDNITQVMISKGWRNEQYMQFILPIVERLYNCGLARIFVTYDSNTPIAAKIFLKNSDTQEYISWLLFYIGKEFNQYNMLQSVEYISRDGGVYNFARGTYGYKMKMLRPVVHNLYTLRWSRSLWGQIGDLFAMNLYHIKQIIKKIIRK